MLTTATETQEVYIITKLHYLDFSCFFMYYVLNYIVMHIIFQYKGLSVPQTARNKNLLRLSVLKILKSAKPYLFF